MLELKRNYRKIVIYDFWEINTTSFLGQNSNSIMKAESLAGD
jgi:hypothetical protein